MSEPEERHPIMVTTSQRSLLRDIIDMYLEGIEGARQETIKDDSLGDLEQLLRVCGGYEETTRELQKVRRQLARGER